MTVAINFHGFQRAVTKKNHVNMNISDKTRVHDALEYVNKLFPELPLNGEMVLITINEKLASLDSALRPDDSISFLPHIGGG
jgi:molybdopterin converting factor small subunit